MIRPDLGDFGYLDTARNSELWDGCMFSCSPALGYTGSMLPNHGPYGGHFGTTAPVWDVVSGVVGVKSGSYSDAVIPFSKCDYVTVCVTCQLPGTSQIVLESSANYNTNNGSFAFILNTYGFTISAKSAAGANINIFAFSTGTTIRSFCAVLKTTVAAYESICKLVVLDGIDKTGNISFYSGNVYAISGFTDQLVYLGARNKTTLPLNGSIFDCAIYNRPFTLAEALRYTANPLERYQPRRRRFISAPRISFNPAFAAGSNIILPAGVSPC